MIGKYYAKISKLLIGVLCTIIAIIHSLPIYAIEDTKEPMISDSEYIFFDLYYGNVTISGETYTGFVLENGTAVKKTYTSDSRKIYIYQSNGENTVWENGLPKYDRVGAPEDSGKTSWGEYITNNTNVENVIINWNNEATAVNRTASPYYVKITGSGNYDITVDNLWSSYHEQGQTRTSGGLSFYPNTATASKAVVRCRGDNRFGNIFYATDSYTNHQMIFEGEENSTVTVADLTTTSKLNFYNSAIGGSDNRGTNTVGLIFKSGIVFAGTTYADNCSAIGGGGNEKGVVTIDGGTITAVVSSTGTAIGGGIGYSSYGGNAEVTINGGTIYAYNFGYEGIPSAAIGGGSSRASDGNASTIVTITGGSVYSQSTGGVAIGGGGSKLKNGGSATINISGGSIVARSIANQDKSIQAGSGIGGGTGVIGGNATLNISGDAFVQTGSIGGGKTHTDGGKIGSATVNISGNPTIQGQFIMESEQDATVLSSFIMTGGTIDNSTKTDEFTFLQENGGAIHIVNGKATIEGGTIKNCSATNGGAVAITGGDFIMTSGSITDNSATNEGGAIYVQDGNIEIGLEECKGNNNSHSHPVIKDNVATNNGGGISITGGQVTLYCGNLSSNKATQNQSGNSISQTGGVFNVIGGNLGTGIYIDKEATFLDLREGIYQVTYYAIYDGVNETMVSEIASNQKLRLPKESELENTYFSRDDLYLIGWSTSSTSEDGYMVVGSEIYITQNTELYAIWGTEPPIASYTVYIPDALEISEKDKKGEMGIRATLKYFTNIASLSIQLEEKGNLKLEDAKISYTLKENLKDGEIQIGDTIASFTSVNQSEKKFLAEITGKAKYAGEYTDTLTFKITYNDGSHQ